MTPTGFYSDYDNDANNIGTETAFVIGKIDAPTPPMEVGGINTDEGDNQTDGKNTVNGGTDSVYYYNDYSDESYDLSCSRLGGVCKRVKGREAVLQAIYKILSTERYKYPVYSTDYGIELSDLFGHGVDYAIAELPRRIKDALSIDSRIKSVSDFDFEIGSDTFIGTRNNIKVSFVVHTIYGLSKANIVV